MTTTTPRTLADMPGGELAALVTVETVERLTAQASAALEAGDLDTVRAIFGAIVDETTIRTATAVKDQRVSDHITERAAMYTGAALAVIAGDRVLAQAQANAEANADAEADAEAERAQVEAGYRELGWTGDEPGVI